MADDTTAGAATCAQPGASGPSYCLVEPLEVRVPGAAKLAIGQAVLLGVDDQTAVIVARDEGGLHALSGICTHACCVVSLCRDVGCSALTVTPGACEKTEVATADAAAESILCPCHGSTFRIADGEALTPPATTRLPSLRLRRDGDDVVVDTHVEVDASARVKA